MYNLFVSNVCKFVYKFLDHDVIIETVNTIPNTFIETDIESK